MKRSSSGVESWRAPLFETLLLLFCVMRTIFVAFPELPVRKQFQDRRHRTPSAATGFAPDVALAKLAEEVELKISSGSPLRIQEIACGQA
mmetsp:Transcript_65637/g.135790  ORF Transcript_65637/g.135790 Transcript_65637/m.135790 type:complete len:90 (+) Transcript_65637:187-456(+)